MTTWVTYPITRPAPCPAVLMPAPRATLATYVSSSLGPTGSSTCSAVGSPSETFSSRTRFSSSSMSRFEVTATDYRGFQRDRKLQPFLAGPDKWEWASGVLEYVIVEHPLYDVTVAPGDVLVHVGIAPEVVEMCLGAIVYAEHGILLVAGPHVLVVAEGKVGTWPGL